MANNSSPPDFISDKDAPDFIPDETPKTTKPSSPLKQAEAGLEGFGQTASFGYLPQLQAAATPVTDKLASFLTGQKVEDPRSYVERRDAMIKRAEQLGTEAPEATLAGKAAGLAAPMLIPGLGELGVAKGGAIMGSLYNPGDTPGEISGAQLPRRLVGGAVGAAGGKVLHSVSKLPGATWRGLKKAADAIQQHAMGIKKMQPGLGTTAIEQGISGSPEQMLAKVRDIKDPIGQTIGESIQQIQEPIATAPVVEQMTAKFMPRYVEPQTGISMPASARAVSGLEELLAPLTRQEAIPATAVQNIRTQLAPTARPSYEQILHSPEYTKATSEMAAELRNILSERLKQQATKQSPELGSKLSEAMSQYGPYRTMEKGLERLTAKVPPNAVLPDLRSAGSAYAGAFMGGRPGALAATLLDRFARLPRGEAFIARQFNRLGNLPTTPELTPEQIQLLVRSLSEAKR